MSPAPDAPDFDLQSHSTRSDGHLEPADVVARAAAAGVRTLALTDHDTVDGVAEALEAARTAGINLIAATELSSIEGDHEDLHILGYGVDHTDPQFLETLKHFRGDRERRAHRMMDALRELGWELDTAEIDTRSAAGEPIGRPHLARAAYDHPANAPRIAKENLKTFSDLLVAYLIPDTPAYRRRSTPTVQEAIDAIHAANGIAVWAHPFWDIEDPKTVEETLRDFKAKGIDGVEAFYVTHDEPQTHLLHDLAHELKLITTGSADFHGPEHPNFATFRDFSLFGRTPNLGPLA